MTEKKHDQAARPKRLKVREVRSVVLGDLAPEPRRQLTERVFELWSEYFLGQDLAGFERSHLFDNTTVVTALGAAGDLAGFSYINRRILEVEGRQVLVLGGGVFNRVEYAGSAALALRSFRAVARLRMQHRRLPCVGVSVATNPLIYDLVTRMFPIFAPRPTESPPTTVLQVVWEIARARNMPIDEGSQWVVQFYGRAAQAARLRASRAYARRTPAMEWFESHAPSWAEGQAVLIWAPLDVANILGAIFRLTRYRLTHG